MEKSPGIIGRDLVKEVTTDKSYFWNNSGRYKGDPQGVPYVVETAKWLLGKVPLFGICLGNQILGLAQGAKTYKLKFGHHGGNHPVKDLRTGRISITVQNHKDIGHRT